MPEIAVRVRELAKLYRIGHREERYRTLRDTLADIAAAPYRRLRGAFRKPASNGPDNGFIWALRDVSFDVKRGEVMGVIGRNGAGKSTLLRILSRITEPTGGYAEIRGRVGSLLEVGTGFHLELTGRENIYFNGSILGMSRREIDGKFDEIVDFAEVSKFIDTPVKHYSSGMHLRLAFAVAAHLSTDILLVDEVLAVGDSAFQRKCMGKMEDVATRGKTVLFVSHNLGAVKELCQSALVLKNGAIGFQGPVVEGLAFYSRGLVEDAADSPANENRWLRVTVNGGGALAAVAAGEPFRVEGLLGIQAPLLSARLFCIINDAVGDVVVHQVVTTDRFFPSEIGAGTYQAAVELPALWLAPGVYTVHFKLIGVRPSGREEKQHSERCVIEMTGGAAGIGRASLAPPLRWSIERGRNAGAA